MANLRIRDLAATTTPPAGAVLPLDASGLTEAQKITPGDLVEAVWYVQLGSNASDNTISLNAALDAYADSGNKRGTLLLPRGAYRLEEGVILTAAHSGLTIQGDGCSLYTNAPSPYPKISPITLGFATGADPMGRGEGISGISGNQFEIPESSRSNYQVNDAIILYWVTTDIDYRNPIQQVAVITDVTVSQGIAVVTVNATILTGVTGATYLYNGRKLEYGQSEIPAGTTELTILGTASAALFPQQSWAYVTDGVGVAEAYGEFVRVLSVDTDTDDTVLTLESGLRNSYITARAAIVPPGRWTEDVTIRGLTLGGSRAVGSNTDLTAKHCVNLTLERVACRLATPLEYMASNGMLIVTSGHVTVRDCDTAPALAFNTTRDVFVQNSAIAPNCEEFCSDITYLNCDIVHLFRHAIGSVRARAVGCRFGNIVSANLLDDSGLFNCDVRAMQVENGDFYMQGDRVAVDGVRAFDGPLRLQFQSGTGQYVGRVGGNVLVIEGSGGRIVGPVYGNISAEQIPYNVIPLPGSWAYTTDVQIPLTFSDDSDAVVLDKLTGLRSAMWVRVHLLATGYGVSTAGTYEIARGYQYPGGWYLCWPLTEGRQHYDATDFALELFDGDGDAWLRLRRTGGTTAVDAIVRIQTNATFEPGGTAPSGGAPTVVHESTALAPRNRLAYLTSPVITQTAAPGDGDLANGQCALWFDTSATAFKIKARDGGGAIRTGSVTLN